MKGQWFQHFSSVFEAFSSWHRIKCFINFFYLFTPFSLPARHLFASGLVHLGSFRLSSHTKGFKNDRLFTYFLLGVQQ